MLFKVTEKFTLCLRITWDLVEEILVARDYMKCGKAEVRHSPRCAIYVSQKSDLLTLYVLINQRPLNSSLLDISMGLAGC